MTSQYKQIGNAVPVNLAEEIGKSLVKTLNAYYAGQAKPEKKMQEKKQRVAHI